MDKNIEEQPGELKTFSSPKLTPEDRLYIRAYLLKGSHAKAYETLHPGLKSYSNYSVDNKYSRKEAVKFHISQAIQERAEASLISQETIIERLWKEAIREGSGSNHTARIQALTLLGKHLGLFEEKKQEQSHTFNIINYSSEPLKIENKEEIPIEKDLESERVLDHIEFKEY